MISPSDNPFLAPRRNEAKSHRRLRVQFYPMFDSLPMKHIRQALFPIRSGLHSLPGESRSGQRVLLPGIEFLKRTPFLSKKKPFPFFTSRGPPIATCLLQPHTVQIRFLVPIHSWPSLFQRDHSKRQSVFPQRRPPPSLLHRRPICIAEDLVSF